MPPEYSVGTMVLGLEETLDRDEQIREMEEGVEEPAYEETYHSALAGYIVSQFRFFRDARRNSGVENEIIDSQRAYNGEYSAHEKARINPLGADIYMHITTTKCRAVASWIKDILLATKKSWSIEPTPKPTLPEDILAQIEEAFMKELEEAEVQEGPQQQVQPGMGGQAQQQEGRQQNPVESAAEKLRKRNQRKRNVFDAIQSEIMFEAKHQLKGIERLIEDQLVEGKWDKALDDFITDFSIFPTAIMKGPIVQKKKKLVYENGRPVPKKVYCYENRRVSPLDFYPQPGACDIDEGDMIEHMRFNKSEIYSLKGLSGYISSKIDNILDDDSSYGWWLDTGIEHEKATLEGHGTEYDMNRDIYHGLHFHGSVPVHLLVDWGREDLEFDDPNKMVEVDALLIGREVIKCQINDDPLFRKPYYKASFQNNPGSFWGHSVPYLMRDIQRMCNACARALADNMALASGPQVEVYIDRLADQGAIEGMHPRQIWQLRSDPTGAGGRAINFFTVPSNAEGLLAVYNQFEQKADDATGVPRYAHGNERASGAAQALADYERVLTPNGAKKISNLKVGDEITNTYGGVSKVVGVYPQGKCDIFRLKFSNGEYVDCDMNHRWSVRTHQDRPFQTLTTEEILSKGLYRKTKKDGKNPKGLRPKWMLPLIDPVYYPYVDVLVDPYTMGAILGDGDHRARLTSMDQEIFDRIPYKLGNPDKSSKCKSWTHTILGIKKNLQKYIGKSICYDKFIPKEYLRNSYSVRVELLRGLMDTDGCISKGGDSFYFTTSKQLAKDFKELVRSLGGAVNKIQIVNDKRGSRAVGYRIHFYTNICPVYLKRKAINYKTRKRQYIYISGVEYVGKNSATCIQVDSRDKCFIVDNFIPTHNTAQGLAMLLESASKGIKDAIRNIDNGLIIPRIEYQFYWNMITKNELNYSGDINVRTIGSQALTLKAAQSTRRQEFLQITANPQDIEVMGMAGRADILREMAEELGLPENLIPHRLDIMKLEEEKRQRDAEIAQAQAQANQVGLEATKIQVQGQMQMHEATQQMKALNLQLQEKALQADATLKSAKMQQDAQIKVMEIQGKQQEAAIKAATTESVQARKEERQDARNERQLAVDMARAEMNERARARGNV